jgi:hypothetical protein
VASQPKTGDADEDCDADGRERVAVRPARPRRRETGEDEARGNEIAGIVQRVGGQRVAAGFSSDALEGAPTRDVDEDRQEDRHEREEIGVDRRRLRPDAAHGHEGDGGGQDEEEAGLRQRGHRLDLGVAERMLVVGGLVGFAHGEISQSARADVERVVRGLGEKRERSRHQPGDKLGERQRQARPDRSERGALLQRRPSAVFFGLRGLEHV